MKVITIDFDIIMAPSISFYDHFIPQVSWNNLDRMTLSRIFYGDYLYYSKLTNWLLFQIKKMPKEKIFFIHSHEQVYNLIDKETHIDLINIDHHHDLGYPGNNNTKLSCANWINFFIKENRLDSYLWINNENSTPPKLNNNYPYKTALLKNYNLNNLEGDMIIICLSPEWVPPYIRPLFNIWTNIYEFYYNTSIEFK